MPWKPHTPGCASCDCVAYLFGDGAASSPTYLDGRPSLTPRPLADFAIAEGSIVSGQYRLTNGQRLAPRASLLGCATAWTHEIDLDGDADLAWDGLTIQLRATAGTVTVGGHVAAIMPTDATTRKTRLILYVTPAWLMVAAVRFHIAPDEYTGNNRTTTTRSSIQLITRANNYRDRVATLTAVGSTNVLAWFAADSTVSLDSDYLGEYADDYADPYNPAAITRTCYRPQLPEGTESNYQAQTAGTNTYLGKTHPDTFSIVGDASAAAEVDYTYFNGTTTTTERWSYASTIGAGFVRLVGLTLANFDWQDETAGTFSTTVADSLGPSVRGGLGTSSFVVRSATVSCCPTSPTSGNQQTHFAQATVDADSRAFWPAASNATPYPRPTIRHRLAVTQYTPTSAILSQEITTADVVPSATGTASATLQTTTETDPITGTGAIRFTDLTVQWLAS